MSMRSWRDGEFGAFIGTAFATYCARLTQKWDDAPFPDRWQTCHGPVARCDWTIPCTLRAAGAHPFFVATSARAGPLREPMRRLPSLIALRFFEETARHLSFNRAAKSLCVTQGAVSRQIRILEESLGEKLFERDHRGIRLTAAGERLVPCVVEAFDILERATHPKSATISRRRLVLALPPTFATQWFSPRLPLLAAALPEVELSVRTGMTTDCHCAIRFGRGALAGAYSELIAIERHTLVGAPSLAGMPVETLVRQRPRLHVLHEDERLNLWPDWLESAGLPAGDGNSNIEFSTLEQAIHAARKGAGLAIVDRNMITEELANGSLLAFSDVQVNGPYGYWLDIAREHVQLSHVQAFVDWLRQQIVVAE